MKDVEILDTTIDEWQAEMELYDNKDVPGKTLSELSQELGVNERTMRRRVLHMIKINRCTSARGQRIDNLGRRYKATVYQLTPKKEKE